MNNAVFTIVAKNYIGLAKILEQSIKDTDIDFFIIVADELDQDCALKLDENILFAKNILGYTNEEWTDLTFKYNLTEFCTEIKPRSFKYLFSLGYQKVIYFDPDIYVYSSLNIIFDNLNDYNVILTPQIAECHVDYKGDLRENDMHLNGIYNLGFLALSIDESTKRMLDWWDKRLKDQCFIDKSQGIFTDQKWIDFVPGFKFDKGVMISHHLGMNLAPWNYFEREVKCENGIWKVISREGVDKTIYDLIFCHFSGYKYKDMLCGEVARQNRALQPPKYEDIEQLIKEYTSNIMSRSSIFNQFIDLSYTYGFFKNGIVIDRFHRRLYNGLIKKGISILDPFDVSKGSLYYHLKKAWLIKSKASQSPDKINENNISNLTGKKRLIGALFKCAYTILGYQKYVLLTRALPDYYRPEEHIFLIENKLK